MMAKEPEWLADNRVVAQIMALYMFREINIWD